MTATLEQLKAMAVEALSTKYLQSDADTLLSLISKLATVQLELIERFKEAKPDDCYCCPYFQPQTFDMASDHCSHGLDNRDFVHRENAPKPSWCPLDYPFEVPA